MCRWLAYSGPAVPLSDLLMRPDHSLIDQSPLTFGLRDDPPAALARTMGHVELARKDAGIERPIQFSACTTDGKRLWSVRYSSNNESRTQYHSRHMHALRDIDGTYGVSNSVASDARAGVCLCDEDSAT